MRIDDINSRLDILDIVTLESMLVRLTEEEREIIYLWAWKDLTFETIGEMVGEKFRGHPLAGSTMRYHFAKILRKLRSWVE